MGPEIPKRPVGRPRDGAESKTIERKVRLEPYVDEQLTMVCQILEITRAEGIRRGIQMFLHEANKIIY